MIVFSRRAAKWNISKLIYPIARRRRAQDIAEAVLDAEVRIGELMAEVTEAPGKRTDLQPVDTTVHKSKKEVIEDAGFSVKQAQRFETIAKHPELLHGTPIKFEMRGEYRPVVSFTWLFDNYGLPAV